MRPQNGDGGPSSPGNPKRSATQPTISSGPSRIARAQIPGLGRSGQQKRWFGQHRDPETLNTFLEASRADHQQRLRLYERIAAPDAGTAALVAFGGASETAVLGWLDDLRRRRADTVEVARQADAPVRRRAASRSRDPGAPGASGSTVPSRSTRSW